MAGQSNPTPEATRFFVGTDARTAAGGPRDGELHAIAEFVIHPQWNPTTTQNDIAMVRLAEPLTDVVPIPHNTERLEAAGGDPTYVGFGATGGLQGGGSGIKRSAVIPIGQLGKRFYFSPFNGSNVCFGDSGGPGLLEVGGELRVVGVNSSVGGCRADDQGCDPCQQGGRSMRVDSYAAFIADTMGLPAPDCSTEVDRCVCAAACQPNGRCDDDVCRTATCEETVLCVNDCDATDQFCSLQCFEETGAQARDLYGQLNACLVASCGNVPAAEFPDCADERCAREIDGCLGLEPSAPPGPDDPVVAPPGPDDPVLPDNCALTGGECGEGTACALNSDGSTDCVPSGGAGQGEACTIDASTYPCGDGLICVGADEAAVCRQACSSATACGDGETCELSQLAGDPATGVCLRGGESSEVVSETEETRTSGSGNGCSAASAGAAPHAGWLLPLAAALLWHRRRLS